MWDVRTAPRASSDAVLGPPPRGARTSPSAFEGLRGAELRTSSHHNACLHRQIQQSRGQSISGLLAALQAKDPYTYQHSLHVADYAGVLARAMRLTESQTHIVYVAALLHDIGKIGIPDAILKKPGRLTSDEFAVMKRHSEIGAAILRPIDFLARHTLLVLHHHEWYDGSGYPAGLKGDAIPLGARILHVADAIDAMLSPRDYKPGCNHPHVLAELRTGRGRQFDPQLADAASDWLRTHSDNADLNPHLAPYAVTPE